MKKRDLQRFKKLLLAQREDLMGNARKVLSGDIITEQNIHTLDVMNWIMSQDPVCAFGTGGQKVRDYGTCWDTFSVTFQYPENVGIAFSSRQFDGFGTQPEGIRNRMFGTDGVLAFLRLDYQTPAKTHQIELNLPDIDLKRVNKALVGTLLDGLLVNGNKEPA